MTPFLRGPAASQTYVHESWPYAMLNYISWTPLWPYVCTNFKMLLLSYSWWNCRHSSLYMTSISGRASEQTKRQEQLTLAVSRLYDRHNAYGDLTIISPTIRSNEALMLRTTLDFHPSGKVFVKPSYAPIIHTPPPINVYSV